MALLTKDKSDISKIYRFYFVLGYLLISLSLIIFHSIYPKFPFLKE